MMDGQTLKALIREGSPFPIAHAHKKMLGVLDQNIQSLYPGYPEPHYHCFRIYWGQSPALALRKDIQ